MKTKDAYNGSRRTGERFLRLWSELAQGVFPFIMEEVGELDYDHRLFVSVCEAVIDPKEFEYAKWCGNGRPKADRVSSRSPPHSKSSPYARPAPRQHPKPHCPHGSCRRAPQTRK